MRTTTKRSLAAVILLGLPIVFGKVPAVCAQDTVANAPADDQQELETKKKAYSLLEQVINDSQFLRLPENRIRVQIGAADLLWDRNEARARSLFSQAAEAVVELTRSTESGDQRPYGNQRTPSQLRQELILTVARHDAALAYQLLAVTRPTTPTSDTGNLRRPDQEDNLEQRLLAQVAALDPMLALQNAEQSLDKGQFPRAIADVLSQLQQKDKEAAAKLEDKTLKKLRSANMLASLDAGGLALILLQPGPRSADSSSSNPTPAANTQRPLLAQSAYVDLMGTVIDAALKATPQATATQRGPNNFRGRGNVIQANDSAPTDAQIEQQNARRLLSGLQIVLPQIDQYLPDRAQSVRQKMTELGMNNNPRAALNQVFNLMQQGTSQSLLAAAPTAPAPLQPRIYQQAALKALDEGNVDQARQIANDHLDSSMRDSVLQAVDFRQTADKTDAGRIGEVRQTLARLRSDEDRVNLLVQLSGAVEQKNPKLALQLLDEARQYTNKRASNYQLFDSQIKLADAFKDLDPARSFEVLESGILQLNELLSAAAMLSGFELNIFKDGELPLAANSRLSNEVMQFGNEVGSLAKFDFERAQTLANKFQLIEPRIQAKLSIVRSLLGKPTQTDDNSYGFRGFGQNFRNIPQ